jgi:hypothetical protein
MSNSVGKIGGMSGPPGGVARSLRIEGALNLPQTNDGLFVSCEDLLTNVNSTLFDLYQSGAVSGYVGRLNHGSIADLAWATTLPMRTHRGTRPAPRSMMFPKTGTHAASSAGRSFQHHAVASSRSFSTCCLNLGLVPPTISESCTAPSAIDCGGPNRDGCVRGAVSLPGF